MKSQLKALALAGSLVAGTLAFPLAASAQERESITFRNDSVWNIRSLYVSPASSDLWGQDILGANTLRPGREFLYYNMRPGVYDLKFIDQDGDSCVLRGVPVYTDKVWDIDSATLLGCEAVN